jgi:hypothetical protein
VLSVTVVRIPSTLIPIGARMSQVFGQAVALR